jgi:hypothetical protein
LFCSAPPEQPQVNGQLQQLPPPPSADASLELFRRLRSLSDAVRDAVQGRDNVAFFRAADSHYHAFREAVMHARPIVQLQSAGSKPSGIVGFTFGQAATPGSSAPQRPTSSSYKDRSERSADFWICSADAAAIVPADAAASAASGQQQQQQHPVGAITLDRVRELAHKYRTDELPEFFPFRVVQELVQSLKGCWDAAAQACLHDVADELQALTASLVAHHFGQFARAEAYIRWVYGCAQTTACEGFACTRAMWGGSAWLETCSWVLLQGAVA